MSAWGERAPAPKGAIARGENPPHSSEERSIPEES